MTKRGYFLSSLSITHIWSLYKPDNTRTRLLALDSICPSCSPLHFAVKRSLSCTDRFLNKEKTIELEVNFLRQSRTSSGCAFSFVAPLFSYCMFHAVQYDVFRPSQWGFGQSSVSWTMHDASNYCLSRPIWPCRLKSGLK